MGDYDVRGRDIDTVFSGVKFMQKQGDCGSICHRAIQLTTAQFDPSFPGWPIYFQLLHGDGRFNRHICAFFVFGARALSRAQKRNGRAYIGRATRRNNWIQQAGMDAMDYVLFGRYAEGLQERSRQLGVSAETYQKIRDPLAAGVFVGIESWRSMLHTNYIRELVAQKTDNALGHGIMVGME